MDNKIKIYKPNSRIETGIVKSIFKMIKNIVNSRELIWQLFKRDFLMAYKKSVFGWGWLFISPLLGVVSWVVLNWSGVLNPGTIEKYPAFVLVGTSIWALFMGFYTSSADTLNAGLSFINQVKYPHEIMLVKQTAQHLANFLIAFLLNIIVMILFGIPLNLSILLFPVLILPMFFLAASIGLVISVASVVFPDIQRIFSMGLSLMFYFTPIVYDLPTKSETLNKIAELNPLTYIVVGVRDVILTGKMQNPSLSLFWGFIFFFVFILGWRIFYISEEKVIEKLT